MDEQQVRELVREALARHLGTSPSGHRFGAIDGRAGCMGAEAFAKAAPSPAGAFEKAAPSRPTQHPAAWKTHLSHGRFVYLAPVEPDAPCIVEPHVRCHHCGFCQSYGH